MEMRSTKTADRNKMRCARHIRLRAWVDNSGNGEDVQQRANEGSGGGAGGHLPCAMPLPEICRRPHPEKLALRSEDVARMRGLIMCSAMDKR